VRRRVFPHATVCAAGKLFSGKIGLVKTAASICQRFWQVRFSLESQTSFQNQSMVVEPVEIQGVWCNPKTPYKASSGRLGLAAFSEDVSEFWRFSVSELFSPQPPEPRKTAGQAAGCWAARAEV
jgi:hypothetical protein